MFVHGFGFDQSVWRYITDRFADAYRIVLVDLVGSGQSDVGAYDFARHNTLKAHADDLLEVLADYCSGPVIFIGHSVGSIIGMLASIKAPQLFSAVVMIAPTPSLINDGAYRGGFERKDIESLLESLENNYLGWSSAMAPTVLGLQAQPESAAKFASGFCRNDPEIGKHFARVTFLSDHRPDLARVTTPTLIIQASNDPFVPLGVGEYMREMIKSSTLAIVESNGHCPHISTPRPCIEAIDLFLKTLSHVEDGQSKEIASDAHRNA